MENRYFVVIDPSAPKHFKLCTKEFCEVDMLCNPCFCVYCVCECRACACVWRLSVCPPLFSLHIFIPFVPVCSVSLHRSLLYILFSFLLFFFLWNEWWCVLFCTHTYVCMIRVVGKLNLTVSLRNLSPHKLLFPRIPSKKTSFFPLPPIVSIFGRSRSTD